MFYLISKVPYAADRSNGFNKLKKGNFQYLWLWGSVDASSRTSQTTKAAKCCYWTMATSLPMQGLLKSLQQKGPKSRRHSSSSSSRANLAKAAQKGCSKIARKSAATAAAQAETAKAAATEVAA